MDCCEEHVGSRDAGVGSSAAATTERNQATAGEVGHMKQVKTTAAAAAAATGVDVDRDSRRAAAADTDRKKVDQVPHKVGKGR